MRGAVPLDRLTVRHLTQAFSTANRETPACIRNWHRRDSSWNIGCEVDWSQYGGLYCSRLTTNRDVHLHFKYILHRRLVLRCFYPSDSGGTRCRCCDAARETHCHLVRCGTLWQVWTPFVGWRAHCGNRYTHAMSWSSWGSLAMANSCQQVLLALHRIVWKMVIIAMT